MTKKGRQFFSGKIGVTPSVAASGVTPTPVTPLKLPIFIYLFYCEGRTRVHTQK